MARIVQSHVEPVDCTSAEEPDARSISNEPVVSEQVTRGVPTSAASSKADYSCWRSSPRSMLDGKSNLPSSLPSSSIFCCNLPCVFWSAFTCRECSVPFF